MGGLSEPTGEVAEVAKDSSSVSPFYPIPPAICVCFTMVDPLQNPPKIDVTTQSDSGSIEYAYRGVFENAYRILGYEIDGPKGQIKTGLLLTGTKDAFTLYDITDDGAFYFARHIDNSGTIQGRDYSIYSLSNVTSLITNSGTLKGDVVLGHGVDQVINTGKIFGALQTGDNTGDWFKSGDHVENHGIIRGIVTMSNFDDIFTAFGDAPVGSVEAPKVVRGGLGNDTLTGANQNDKFRGNDGNDQLNGLGGNDLLYGGAGRDKVNGDTGDDLVVGNAGNDALFGGAGDDRIIGGNGADRLVGNGGDDNLRGGPGQDQIIGGHGQDRLWGGTGADVFVFRAVEDSAADAPSDRILDFEPGVDRIDLSQMSTDIAFVGDRVFSATGDVELRFSVPNSGTARVMLDVDGDGTGDLRFLVLDTLHLTTSDFIL